MATDYTETLSGTVDDVNAYIAEHPDEREAVLAAEADGQGRKGIVEGPHAEATTDPADPAADDAQDGRTSTRGATFQEAAAEVGEVEEVGYVGTSPEAERTGRRDKGLSQRNPAVMNRGGMAPDASPHVDDSEAIKGLRSIKD